MTTRITGYNSGLDVDALVKASLTTYQSKVDKEVQNKKVMEYQQEQYKQIMSDASDFYDKYCDMLKTGSLVSSSTYQTQTYKSSDDGKVTAKGLAGASLDNYTVSVTQLAAKATDKLDLDTETGAGKTITIGTATITFNVVADGSTTVSNYNSALAAEKARLTAIANPTAGETAQLEDLNNNTITATYSEFTNSVTFTSSAFGGDGFTLNAHAKAEDKYLHATITNSNGDTYTLDDTDEKTENVITVDNVQFTFKGLTNSTSSNSKYITSLSIDDLLGNDIKNIVKNADNSVYTLTNGSKITIKDDGTTTVTKADGITQLGAAETVSFTNTEGATITLKGDGTLTTSSDNSVKLTGTTDVTSLKDKIVKFVDDYNTLIKSINTKIYETRDTDYMPLTDAQKEEMTESQITAWEKKAQTGLLRKDSDLERIVREMKNAMSTVVSGSGLSLEKIGISPVKDYTDKNGMLTVDEDKLTQALEESGGDVRDLFTRAASTTESGGALTQLKSSLYNEFKTSTSSLSKKAGLAGSSTEYDNTLTKSIYKKKLLIVDLNEALADKENALYKKYSALETALQSLNSQQSSLASMLGTS